MSFALPPKFINETKYTGDELASIPAVNNPRAPLTTDVHYPLFTIWRNNNSNAMPPDNFGDAWILVKFMVPIGGGPTQAIWVKFTGGSVPGGTVLSLSDTANLKTFPDASGNIQLVGGAGINVVSTPASNLLTFSLAGGGTAIDQIAVDAGVTPVVADGAGQITATATQIATGIIAANAIRTNGTGANTMAIEIQRSTAVAATDVTKNGISHYNSTQFTVDANAFVSLAGGVGPTVLTLTGDTGAAVGPDGTGTIHVVGQTVPNTSGIQINGAANTLNATMFSPFAGNFTFTNATAGTQRVVVVENTDTAAASIAEFQTLVAAGSVADSFINTGIGAVRSYAFGVDNSVAGDPLKITTQADANASPSSASIILNSTPDGEVTLPLQPAFLAINTGAANNITGAGTLYQLGTTALTITFDVNGDFNANGTLTSPVTGKWSLGFNLFIRDVSAAMTIGQYGIQTSNRTFTIDNNPANARDANNEYSVSNFVFTDMDAADTAVVNFRLSNGAGDTADLMADAQPWASFFGQLEC